MAAPRETVWTLEPHTAAKHDLLRHYLKAWYPILGKSSKRVVFLDGFAGPGIYEGGQSGSPIIAINTLLKHSHFHNLNSCEFVFLFIEKDAQRVQQLKDELNKLDPLPSNISINTFQGEFQNVIGNILSHPTKEKTSLAPTLAFIDPFGFSEVPMDIIQQFLSARKYELIMILMVDHLNRFKSYKPVQSRLETLYGTTNFDDVKTASNAIPVLVNKYKNQLKKVARFSYTLDFQIKRTDGHNAYYIVYATHNIMGVKKFKDAMWNIDPAMGQLFSDLHWNQIPLFTGPDVDTTELKQQLAKQFSGKTVSIEEIEKYVLLETPHTDSHIKRFTLAPMEKAKQIKVINPPAHRKSATFPARTKIYFEYNLGI
ncbi:MAG: three-Cys-motif partner protein TcmP [Acidimicrobiia bacterium]|nr:three-Cys-motif partner protein TcmP [Acidimicrobiia bacterium]MYC58553.1 three-Cys-motif partner protein TcmP [Acidimicrobiia bacterium]MYI30340.1 three-Cys-motif partner protein TcmP [Acidimicrobiia bacterium]